MQVRYRTRRTVGTDAGEVWAARPIVRMPGMVRVARVVLLAACAGVSLSLACTSSNLSSVGPTTSKCRVSVTRLPGAVAAGGATASLAVSAQPECAWDAASDASWIADLTPRSGQGNGEVAVRVIANPSPAPRQGNVQINAEVVPIAQEAAPCVFQVTPTTRGVPAAGGVTTVEVAAVTGCSWTATSDSSWISVRSGAAGNGSGVVTLAVDANPGAGRTGAVRVAGRTVTVEQQAMGVPPATTCAYTLAPATSSIDAIGGQRTFTVTTPAGCAWTATTANAQWITIASGASGTGTGVVTISAAPNTGAQRIGTIDVAGQTHTVTQAAAGAACSYALNPTSFAVGGGGGANVVSVTAGAGCAWSAVSSSTWITVTAGASGSGNGSASFTVSANTGNARAGTLTIAGQTVTVNQAAPCAYSIDPNKQKMNSSAGTGTVAVTTSAGCAWTAVSNASWIAVTGGASGSGPGTVSYSVTANNTGKDRDGTVTIAGRTFTVEQDKN